MSTLVPVGSVLSRVYFAVPTTHTIGFTFDTLDEAAREARQRKDEGWERDESGARVWIDERWVMQHPAERGGSTDVIVSRVEFAATETRPQWAATRRDHS